MILGERFDFSIRDIINHTTPHVIKKIKEPKLGPKFYFGENNHTTLDPYLTDKEVVDKIKELV